MNTKVELQNKIENLQKPVQYNILSLFELLKFQKGFFVEKSYYKAYLHCFQSQINKDFDELLQECE